MHAFPRRPLKAPAVLRGSARFTYSPFLSEKRRIVHMSFGASVAVLVLVIAIVAGVAYAYFSPRPTGRKRKVQLPLESLESLDPPTITHYGHG